MAQVLVRRRIRGILSTQDVLLNSSTITMGLKPIKNRSSVGELASANFQFGILIVELNLIMNREVVMCGSLNQTKSNSYSC